ncbi:MAG: efflux RND transporter periplasmic adaptor subunit, partial [Sphingobacteriales bacterium]
GEKTEAAGVVKSEVIPVKIVVPESNFSGASLNVAGKFTTDDEVFLSFKTGGIIQRIFVKEGEAVTAGQVLATLNMTEINAQEKLASIGYEKAKRDHRRVMNLFRDSVATLEQLQNAETAVDLALQQLTAAKFNKSYSEIRAPKSGYVLRKIANEGQVVSPGTNVLQTNSAAGDNWIFKAGLGDRDWSKVKINDPVIVETEAAPGVKMDGYVLRRSEGVDPATGVFTIDIKLKGKNPAFIASGMFGNATIQVSAATGLKTWAIPYDAIIDGDGRSGYVYVTNDNKTAARRKVSIVSMEKDLVLVDGGLEPSDHVIVSGSAYLTDNSPIKIIQ